MEAELTVTMKTNVVPNLVRDFGLSLTRLSKSSFTSVERINIPSFVPTDYFERNIRKSVNSAAP